MRLLITLFALALGWGFLSLGVVAQQCESYGVDFHNGGSYFQNISSSDPFTFVSIYENCEADVATNILVDPNGDEYLCSDTPLQPDDVEELSTCPLNKNQMYSGSWAVVILSNNGNGDPIAYERDFDLAVGVPVTTTYTPTISVTVTSTPISTITSVTTNTTTSTITTTTVLPAKTRIPTVTITPQPITTTKVFGPTIKRTAYDFEPILTTKTTTKTCHTSTQSHRDPTLTWLPTSLPTKLTPIITPLNLLSVRSVPVDPISRISSRKASRLLHPPPVQKRAPDSSTFTLTATDPTLYPTTTLTTLAPTSTVTLTNITTTTQFTTTTQTLHSGVTTLPPVTTTLGTRTVTKWKATVLTTTVATVTKRPVFTVTVGKVDPKATGVCWGKGGVMV